MTISAGRARARRWMNICNETIFRCSWRGSMIRPSLASNPESASSDIPERREMWQDAGVNPAVLNPGRNSMKNLRVILTGAAIASFVALTPNLAAADAKQAVGIAAMHAGLAANAGNINQVRLHLHHVLNCL